MLEIVPINFDNILLLKNFIEHINSKFFRYFNTRNINVIQNHKYTILLINNNDCVGYGHIDFEDNMYWLGIYIKKEFRSQGLSKIIMNDLIKFFNTHFPNKILHLTVDNDNIIAYTLYVKYGFTTSKINNKYKLLYYKMNTALIDLVYPCHAKDTETLKIAIHYAKLNIKNLRNIYVISKTKLTDNAIWIREDIFPFTYQDMIDKIGNHFRTGWYYAGWLHLYAAITIPGILENVLICDADTFFIQPVLFIENNQSLFNISPSDGTPLYFEHMKKLVTNLTPQIPSPWSGIAHHILINKNILQHMFKNVEMIHKKPFWEAWIDVTLERYTSCPSKFENSQNKHEFGPGRATSYELYFNYAFKYFPEKVKIRKLRSILSYKGFLNIKNCKFVKDKSLTRTNINKRHVQIIPNHIENTKIFNSFEECIHFHIQECIKKNFDTVTFQNHQREGIGSITGNSHGNKR